MTEWGTVKEVVEGGGGGGGELQSREELGWVWEVSSGTITGQGDDGTTRVAVAPRNKLHWRGV